MGFGEYCHFCGVPAGSQFAGNPPERRQTLMSLSVDIRKKLGDDSKNPRYIKTAWGKGYYAE